MSILTFSELSRHHVHNVSCYLAHLLALVVVVAPLGRKTETARDSFRADSEAFFPLPRGIKPWKSWRVKAPAEALVSSVLKYIEQPRY